MAKNRNENLEAQEPMEKQPWQRMELSYIGDAAELIQGGGGKLTPAGGDPGEHRKQSGGTD